MSEVVAIVEHTILLSILTLPNNVSSTLSNIRGNIKNQFINTDEWMSITPKVMQEYLVIMIEKELIEHVQQEYYITDYGMQYLYSFLRSTLENVVKILEDYKQVFMEVYFDAE